jgi:hypothetical protein
MLRWTSVLLLLCTLSVATPLVHAAEKPYSTGKFIAVQQKTREKVDMYLVNTPVTTAVPYFEISVEFGDTSYVAEYTPRHSSEELPEAWRPGESFQGRIEKHRLYLRRPDGSDVAFIISKRISSKPETH